MAGPRADQILIFEFSPFISSSKSTDKIFANLALHWFCANLSCNFLRPCLLPSFARRSIRSLHSLYARFFNLSIMTLIFSRALSSSVLSSKSKYVSQVNKVIRFLVRSLSDSVPFATLLLTYRTNISRIPVLIGIMAASYKFGSCSTSSSAKVIFDAPNCPSRMRIGSPFASNPRIIFQNNRPFMTVEECSSFIR